MTSSRSSCSLATTRRGPKFQLSNLEASERPVAVSIWTAASWSGAAAELQQLRVVGDAEDAAAEVDDERDEGGQAGEAVVRPLRGAGVGGRRGAPTGHGCGAGGGMGPYGWDTRADGLGIFA